MGEEAVIKYIQASEVLQFTLHVTSYPQMFILPTWLPQIQYISVCADVCVLFTLS